MTSVRILFLYRQGMFFAGLTLAYLLTHHKLISTQQAYRRQKHVPDGAKAILQTVKAYP